MKRFAAMFLALLLTVTTVSAAEWPSWAESARTWAEDNSVSEEILAQPDATVTRGMAAQLFYETAGSPEVTGEPAFSDVAGDYADAVTWAAEAGYVQGVGGGLYEPERTLTRQAFAAMLYRGMGSPAVSGPELDQYQDAASVSAWAADPLLWCVQTGLIAGTTDTTLSPLSPITVRQALVILERASYLPDMDVLQRDIEELAGYHRPIGSQGEKDAVEYLQNRFENMGYEVELQSYTAPDGRTGSNVIATKAAGTADADILVVSAHHDTVVTAYGASDNGSGVGALLAVADALKDVSTDTELRFISFTGEEDGKLGSRYYTSKLSAAEKQRMIGDIQFDMIGGLGASGVQVCTMDGEANWLTDLLQSKSAGLPRNAESASDHAPFQLAGIPAVQLTQMGRGYLYHSAADTAENLNYWTIAGAARAAAAAVTEIVSADTASYRTIARQQGDGYAYPMLRETTIYFASSLEETESYIGASGELVDTETVSGEGWEDVYTTYRYSMRWFNGEKPMNTYYLYRNGYLDSVEIRPYETGYTAAQVESLMRAMYGEPTNVSDGVLDWEDATYSKFLSLAETDAGCVVNVTNYTLGITNILASYQVVDGEAQGITDPMHRSLWQLVCDILPKDARQRIVQFDLFTDGASNGLAYTAPIQNADGTTDNSRFSIAIDYYDAYHEDGTKGDWSKLIYTIIHEYGHALLEDNTQIDLTVGQDVHDPAGFIEGSFRKEFYDEFWADLGDSAVNDYAENPTHYASRYGANYFHEDMADTFALFVLGSKPQGDTVAEEKLLFFWAEPEMVSLRSAIRANLGLEA